MLLTSLAPVLSKHVPLKTPLSRGTDYILSFRLSPLSLWTFYPIEAAWLRIVHCVILYRFYLTQGHYPGHHVHYCHGLVYTSFRISPQFDDIAQKCITRPYVIIHGLAAALPRHQARDDYFEEQSLIQKNCMRHKSLLLVVPFRQFL